MGLGSESLFLCPSRGLSQSVQTDDAVNSTASLSLYLMHYDKKKNKERNKKKEAFRGELGTFGGV
jgi:hypothetical protein